MPPGRAELGDILSYLVRELERLEVQIRLNTSFSIKLLEELHVIGDAKKPRHLMFAISEAEEVARTL